MGSRMRAVEQFAASATMKITKLLFLATTLTSVWSSCKFEGKEICEGAVTKELSTVVKICVEGKLKLKKKTEVEPGYPKAGGECVWYGEVLCDGAVVRDLHRWWFLSKCSNNRMTVIGRPWVEVVRDPRYRKTIQSVR